MEKCIQCRGIWGYVGIDRDRKGPVCRVLCGHIVGNTWFRDWGFQDLEPRLLTTV